MHDECEKRRRAVLYNRNVHMHNIYAVVNVRIVFTQKAARLSTQINVHRYKKGRNYYFIIKNNVNCTRVLKCMDYKH